MKNIFACFIVALSFIQLKAQPAMVTVDVRYRIDPKDPAIPQQQFFVSRLDEGFTIADKKALLELTAMRIWQKANSGDSIAAYDPMMELFPGFTPYTYIYDCKNLKPIDFSKPTGQIGGQAWAGEREHSYFKLRAGKVVCEHMIVENNKKIVYAVDTVLTTDKTGKKFIPLLKYRYLEPGQVSVFFTERWNFDLVGGRMMKNVNYYGYFIKKETSAGDFVGYTPALCIQNPEPSGALAKPLLLKKNVVCDVAVNWPEQMIRNDSNMQRYSGADAVNYLTISEGNIAAGDRSKMLAGIFNYAMLNPKNVFPASSAGIDTLHSFVSSEQIAALFSKVESADYFDPNTDEIKTVSLTSHKTLDDVYAIRFYEDWYYDANELTIKKVVRGVGFIMLNRNNIGEPLLEDAGIYIKMN